MRRLRRGDDGRPIVVDQSNRNPGAIARIGVNDAGRIRRCGRRRHRRRQAILADRFVIFTHAHDVEGARSCRTVIDQPLADIIERLPAPPVLK